MTNAATITAKHPQQTTLQLFCPIYVAKSIEFKNEKNSPILLPTVVENGFPPNAFVINDIIEKRN